ncbi:MAG: type II toxin-antitoxin system VapB family antitoxin [Reichenbachiella sp.]|uniref:type II toxin-antitoxin system VapB family antitoxin n=1 Tax=Reichenbachiella sp. TaxID=2184521 RepID=UPI002966D72C|nr:type II toxin-antitoxin system VapB family antitoxin [Reichenbachiella sp.]MDW3209006.1 type II toxin-antitoxin system VapB family antitoxin [Reichenbachiella sp.]
MRTTLDLPVELIKAVMEITGAKTKSQAVKSALEKIIQEERRLKLLTYKGKVDLDIDLNTLRGRN